MMLIRIRDFTTFIFLGLMLALASCVPSTVETSKVNPASAATGTGTSGAPEFYYASSTNIYTMGVPFTLTPTITNSGQNLSFTLYGTLPTGLTFDSSTGTINGTPTSIPGSTAYAVVASNDDGSAVEEVILVTGPVFSYSATNYDYQVGVAFTAQSPTITYPSSGTMLFSISPALPTGMTFNTATGQISGTPSASSGTTSFTITASANGASSSISLGLFVAQAPIISYTTPANYTRNTAYSLSPSITYSGTGIAITVDSGTLPNGLTLNGTTGVISGTPTGSGNQAVTIRFTNNFGTNTQTINFVEIGPPIFSTITYATTFQRGVAFSLDLEAALTFPSAANVSYTSSPALPNANCSLSLNASSGVISGTIATNATTTASDCARTYTITATNNADPSSSTQAISVTLTQTGPPQFEFPLPALTYTYNTAFSATPTIYYSGTGLTFSVNSGTLPPGVTLNASTGVISGTPTGSVNSQGNIHQVVIKATNSVGNTTFTLDFSEDGPIRLSYSSAALEYYRQNVAVPAASTATITFCKGGCNFTADPSTPPEVTVDPSTGEVTIQTIATKRSGSFVITAEDANGATKDTTFSIAEACWANGGAFGSSQLGTQAFGGGGGTSVDPWLLCAENHINEISTNGIYLDDYFLMTSDIQMTAATRPIGSSLGSCFTGGFDGAEHVIHDFKVYSSINTFPHTGYPSDAAFFHCLDDFDYVKKFTLSNLFVITGNGNAAGLAGRANPGLTMSPRMSEIANVYIYGAFVGNNTTGPGSRLTAGLISYVGGDISTFKPLIVRNNVFHGTIYQRSPVNHTASGLFIVEKLSNTPLSPSRNVAFMDQTYIGEPNFPDTASFNNYIDFNDYTAPGTVPTLIDNVVVNMNGSAFSLLSTGTNSRDFSDPVIYDLAGYWVPQGFSSEKVTDPSSGARTLVPDYLCGRDPGHIIFRPTSPNPWDFGSGLNLLCQ